MSDKILGINSIIWKKINLDYRCFSNNCNIENGIKLTKYIKLKKIEYGDCYFNLNETKEYQFIKDNIKIILKYIPEDIIFELHIPIADNLYLLSSISHKIRNPLTNIMGVLTLLNELKMDKTQKKYIGMLENSSYDIVGVANDIIDIINLTRDEIKLNFEKINISKLFQECHNILIKDIEKKNLIFKTIINKKIPEIIIIDPQRLKQIIINILNNAVYQTNIGSISLEITLYDKSEKMDNPFPYIETKSPEYNLLFKIKDTGCGMDACNKKLVENTLGIDKTDGIKPSKYGGFGLLINKYLCKLFRGNIWFKSELDIGSIFYFNILCDGISLI